MGLRLKNQQYGECFFISTSFDRHEPRRDIPGVYEALGEAINFRVNSTRSKLIAYVFMPSHLHLLLFVNGKTLSSFMRDFKKFTAQKALVEKTYSRRIWKAGYDRQVIWSEDVLKTKMNYIHFNPVKAGLVSTPEEWYWLSAADYGGRKDGPVRSWMQWC